MSLWDVTKHKKPFQTLFWHRRHVKAWLDYASLETVALTSTEKNYGVPEREK